MAFKDRLKLLRSQRGITQEDLATALDMPASSIRRYESSDEGMPKNERLQALADYFGCTVDYLLERTEEKASAYKKEDGSAPSEGKFDLIIRETEIDYNVTLHDDPVVEKMVREILRGLAQAKQRD